MTQTRAEELLEFFGFGNKKVKQPDETEKHYGSEISISKKGTNIDSSSRQGTIRVTYGSLVKAFGIPKKGREVNHKIGVEWFLDFTAGKRKISVNIYDWKQNKAYVKTMSNDDEDKTGLDPQDVTVWEVGGKSPEAMHILTAYLRQNGVEYKKISY